MFPGLFSFLFKDALHVVPEVLGIRECFRQDCAVCHCSPSFCSLEPQQLPLNRGTQHGNGSPLPEARGLVYRKPPHPVQELSHRKAPLLGFKRIRKIRAVVLNLPHAVDPVIWFLMTW